MKKAHSDPLGSGVGSTRFSDPRRGLVPEPELFRVVYGAQDLETAFSEVVLRDTTDDRSPPHLFSRGYLAGFHGGWLTVRRRLRLVDVTTDETRRSIGLPTDVVKASTHDLSRRHALAFHSHPSRPDGILYRSRYTDRLDVAVFDRAVRDAFDAAPLIDLLDFDLTAILTDRRIEIIPDGSSAVDLIV